MTAPLVPSSLRTLHDRDRAPLVDHLDELRTRLIMCVAVLVVAFGVFYWRANDLFDVLSAPLDDRWPLQTFGVTEPFFTTVSIAAQAAFVVTLPVIVWHLWRFVRPAVPEHARRAIATLLFVAPALFVSGVAFGYFLVLGPAVQFLLGLSPASLTTVVRASDYFSFITTLLLAMGAIFCFPLVLLGLARVGILTTERLTTNRRTAFVVIVIIAALLPTADPVSLALEVLPLLVLFELSIIAVRVQERMLERRRAEGAA